MSTNKLIDEENEVARGGREEGLVPLEKKRLCRNRRRNSVCDRDLKKRLGVVCAPTLDGGKEYDLRLRLWLIRVSREELVSSG